MVLRSSVLRYGACVLALAAALGVLAPSSASAHGWHRGGGGYGAGAFIGGLAAGAIVGSILAGPHYRAPAPYYAAPAYAYPAYDSYAPSCYFSRQWVWNGYEYVLRRVRVCQ